MSAPTRSHLFFFKKELLSLILIDHLPVDLSKILLLVLAWAGAILIILLSCITATFRFPLCICFVMRPCLCVLARLHYIATNPKPTTVLRHDDFTFLLKPTIGDTE